MTIFTTLKTEIGNKIQKSDSTYLAKIGAFLNRRYETLWNMYPWTPLVIIDEVVTTTAGQSALYLPKYVGQIICLTQRSTNAIILPTSPYVFQRQYLDTITEASDPIAYVYAGESAVKAQPSAASTITVQSSSTSDITQKVRIWGKVSGEEISELVSLSGTTAVAGTNSYTSISRVSKDAVTAGYVTVKASTTTLATISPRETASTYTKINLYKTSATALSVYLTYRKKFQKLDYDEDVIEIPVIEPTLVQLGYSDCLREQGQFSKASMEENNAWTDLNKLILGSEVQKDQVIQMLPHIERSSIDTQL